MKRLDIDQGAERVRNLLRAMTLEHSTWLGWVLPALLFPDFSLHDERVIDFKQLAGSPLPDNPVPVPFVNDVEGPAHG